MSALAERKSASACSTSGRRVSNSDGKPAGMSARIVCSPSRAVAARRSWLRLPEQQDEPVLDLRASTQLCGLVRLGLLDNRLRQAQIQLRAGAGVELKFDDVVRGARRLERLLRHREQFIVGEHGQVLIGNLRHQQDFRGLASLYRCEVLLEGGRLETAEAAEQVDFPSHRQADRIRPDECWHCRR